MVSHEENVQNVVTVAEVTTFAVYSALNVLMIK